MQGVPDGPTARRDVFICHAGEDKSEVASPLADALRRRNLTVWLDEQELRIGDSLLAKIDEGLTSSTFGVVIVSPSFFGKSWPRRELEILTTRELSGDDVVVLPVWHKVDESYVMKYSPSLANKFAAVTTAGLEQVADQIAARVRPLNEPAVADSRRWRVNWHKWWPLIAGIAVAIVVGARIFAFPNGGGSTPPEPSTTQPGPPTTQPAPSDSIRDTFDVDAQGWTTLWGADIKYEQTGGRPGGHLTATDNLAQSTWFWVAPPKYLGNQTVYAGRSLTFDLKQSLSGSSFDAADVWLSGNGVELVYDDPTNPGKDWTSYTVPLDGKPGWFRVTPAGNVAATAEDMRSALANVAYLRIRGEFEVGFDVGGLDNVVLGA